MGGQAIAILPLAGGFSPFIATALLAWAGSYWPVAVYLMILAAITAVSVYLAEEMYQSDIYDERPQRGEGVADQVEPT